MRRNPHPNMFMNYTPDPNAPVLRYLLVHPELGVFLGEQEGVRIWSLLDPVGQEFAPTFPTEAEAAGYLSTWRVSPDALPRIKPVAVHLRQVQPNGAAYATRGQCVAAGAPDWDPLHVPAAIAAMGGRGGHPRVNAPGGVA